MAKVQKVFKYGTGDVIPEGAIYLSTQVEEFVDISDSGQRIQEFHHNQFVWHYFLVEVNDG